MIITLHKILLSALVLVPALLGAQTILIDFGDESTQTTGLADTWNNAHLGILAAGDTGTLFADLKDSTNTGTGITLNITNAFDGRNAAGIDTGTPPYATTATEDSFYTATATASTSPGDGLGIFEFTELDSSKTYDFTMFASRMITSDNRETEYALLGANSETVYLNAANNTANTITASGISPTDLGVITLTVQAGSNNESDYSYIGVVKITVIPEPGSMALLFGAVATGFVTLRRRR